MREKRSRLSDQRKSQIAIAAALTIFFGSYIGWAEAQPAEQNTPAYVTPNGDSLSPFVTEAYAGSKVANHGAEGVRITDLVPGQVVLLASKSPSSESGKKCRPFRKPTPAIRT